MAPMSCVERRPLSPAQRRALLDVARQAIAFGLRQGRPLDLVAGDYDEGLRQELASFVTLRLPDGELRGCMGSSHAVRPLVQDVARNAYCAAFLDPRFPALRAPEADGLHLHLSVLSPLERMAVASQADLLARVRPGVDGLLIEDGMRRGTLLPSVWAALPDPARFLHELWRKAGLAGDDWPPTLAVYRYTTESFS